MGSASETVPGARRIVSRCVMSESSTCWNKREGHICAQGCGSKNRNSSPGSLGEELG